MTTLVARPLLLPGTLGDSWEIESTSTFVAGSPAGNVQVERHGFKARSTDSSSGTPWQIIFDGGSADVFDPDDLVAWLGYIEHDGDAGTLEYRIRTSANPDLSTPTYDSGAPGVAIDDPWSTRGFSHSAVITPTGATSRYLGVDLWVANGTYIDVGRILIDGPFQPNRGAQKGTTDPTPVSRPTMVRGARGQEWVVPGAKYQQAVVNLVLDEAEALGAFASLLEDVANNGAVLYTPDPTDTTYRQQRFIYGRLLRYTELKIPGNFSGHRTVRVTVQELH